MELGRYGKPLDFQKYEMSHVRLSFFDFPGWLYNCGVSAASLLTNVKPAIISKEIEFKEIFPVKLMVKFLKKHKFQVIKLDIATISNSEEIVDNLNKRHLLLCHQMFKKNESSWVVSWNDYLFHNFQIELLRGREFLNRPLLNLFLLYRKTWR